MATQQVTLRKVPWYKFPGHWATLAGALQGFMGYGFVTYAWSTFTPQFAKEFGWSAALIGGAGSVQHLLQIPLSPMGGWLTDRIGPRWNGILTTIAMAASWILLAMINSPLWLYIVYGVFMNIGYNGGLYKVSFPAVNRFFIRLRGRGIGLLSLGAGFGGLILVPLSAILTMNYGWRAVAIAIGVATLVVGISTSFLFVSHLPEHYGLHPDNESPEDAERRAAQAAAKGQAQRAVTGTVDYTQSQILHSVSFWFLVIAGMATFGNVLLPFFQNMRLQAMGYSLTEAAGFYSLNFLFGLVGQGLMALFSDFIAERLSIRVTLAMTCVLQTIGMLLFALASNNLFVIGWAVFYGVGHGAWIPLGGQVMGAYFGRRAMGFAYGLWVGLVGVSGAIAPLVLGWMKDVTGDWTLPFMVGVAGNFLAAVVYLAAVKPRPKAISLESAT